MAFNLSLGTQWPVAIRRAFGIRDGAIQVVSPEIQPSFDVWDRPEWWALAGGDLGVASATLNALAANFSILYFVNPAGSGMLDIIEGLRIGFGATGVVKAQILLAGAAPGTLLGNGGRTDSRRMGTPATPSGNTSLQVRTLQQVGSVFPAISSTMRVRQLANTTGEYRAHFVLGPGSLLVLETGAVNELLDASILFRERAATADETGPL